jgi:PIN domain nuclease of toxin-antitoxin system
MKMNKVKTLIREYEKVKDPFQRLLVLGSIHKELEILKKDLSKKIK